MKTIKLFAFILMLVTLKVYSQTEPSGPMTFVYKLNGSTTTASLDASQHTQNDFVYGFQWSGSVKMMSGLKMNADANSSIDAPGNDPSLTGLYGVHQAANYWQGIYLRNAASMQYEPGLFISSPGTYTTFSGDPTNPVFGFKDIDINAQYITDGNNNHWLELNRNNYNTEIIVLQNPWPDDQLIQFASSAGQFDGFTGDNWYISLKIKVTDDDPMGVDPNEPILKIKLPYTKGNGSSDAINFNFLPSDSYSADNEQMISTYLNQSRGYRLKLKSTQCQGNTKEFIITRGMLPAIGSDVVISANYTTKGPLNTNDNWKYKWTDGVTTDPSFATLITNQKIEISYYGHSTVQIDWTRIENNIARDLYAGRFDDDISGPNKQFTPDGTSTQYGGFVSIYNGIQAYLTNVQSQIINGVDKWKLFRFYGQDVEGKTCQWWGMLRYYNILTGGMAVTRDNARWPELYEHYTKANNRYIGIKLDETENYNASPSIRYGNYAGNSLDNMCYKVGLSWARGYTMDTLNSYYDYYSNQLTWNSMIQRVFKDENNSYLLFSDKKWWMNTFLGFNLALQYTPVKKCGFQYLRPKTYEELNLILWTQLCLGAKGIFVDGEHATVIPNNYTPGYYGFFGIGDGSYINPPTYDIYHDIVGGDYFSTTYDNCNFSPFINYSTVANELGINSNRIYMGFKSTRYALGNLGSLIHNNNTLLMSLKLAAWCSKGYNMGTSGIPYVNTEYIQDPTLAANYMDGYIDRNAIKTRKLYQPTIGQGNVEVTQYENNSLLDITLLKDASSDVFYIGAVNRINDALIYFDPEHDISPEYSNYYTSPEAPYLLFLSYADMINLCENGGPNPDYPSKHSFTPEEWRTYFHKQLGAREITIPFNYKDVSDPNKYNLLRVTELLTEPDPGTGAPWWRQERFKRSVDTIIGMDIDLAVKFQAGEGKIFKCEVIRPDVTQEGNLDFSNQCKMVSHSVLDPVTGNETDEIMYHLTYSKKVPDPLNPLLTQNRVYYVGSQPIKKDLANNENIIWQQPAIDISENILFGARTINQTGETYFNCLYPSLVARKDNYSNALKVYVVYSIDFYEYNVCQSPCINSNCYELEYPIAEAILTYTGSIYPPAVTKNIIVPMVKKFYLDVYPEISGCPVVAAAELGNYYAWSDGRCGIGVNYKLPNATGFTNSSKYLNYNMDYNAYTYTFHPSVDTYNEPLYSSNSCPLVWYEYSVLQPTSPPPIYPGDFYNLRRVIYTELYVDQNTIYNSLPNMPASYPINNNCLRVSDNPNENTMPVVLRKWNIYSGEFSPIIYYDQIFWESKKTFYPTNQAIDLNYRALYTNYNTYLGSLTTSKYISTFVFGSIIEQLYQPDITTGDSKFGFRDLHYPDNQTNSFNVLNFKDYISIGPINQILQMDYTSHSLLTDGNLLGIDMAFLKVTNGNLSHLSKNWDYNKNSANKMWRNRRIMESVGSVPGSSNKYLIPNAKYFYRGADDEITSEAFVGFIESYDRRFKYMINVPKVEDNPVNLILPYQEYTDSSGNTDYIEVPTDTIASEWFHVQNTATLNYKLIFADTINSNLYIQKQSNNELIYIPRPGDFETDMCFMVYFLINGNNDDYRLLLIKNDTTLTYEERLYVGNVDVQDTIFSKNNTSQPKFIDLSGSKVNETDKIIVMVYPNPASDKIYFTATLPASEYLNRYDKKKISDLLTPTPEIRYLYDFVSRQ
jgi:hypothetical protein